MSALNCECTCGDYETKYGHVWDGMWQLGVGLEGGFFTVMTNTTLVMIVHLRSTGMVPGPANQEAALAVMS